MRLKCHIYGIPGVVNMRDIGGYPAKDGRKTVMHRFIRSTALHAVDPGGVAELEKIGVDCVIDLRSTAERKRAPDVIERHEKMHFRHVPMLDYIASNTAKEDFSSFPKSLTEIYKGLLDNAGQDFKEVFDLFADARFGRYLYHCTAGKDRTGVTTMLLLGLAGVDDDSIIEDYSYTELLMEEQQKQAAAAGVPLFLLNSAPENMREALAYLYENYGSVPQYLERIGIGRDKQDIIRSKLLDGKIK